MHGVALRVQVQGVREELEYVVRAAGPQALQRVLHPARLEEVDVRVDPRKARPVAGEKLVHAQVEEVRLVPQDLVCLRPDLEV